MQDGGNGRASWWSSVLSWLSHIEFQQRYAPDELVHLSKTRSYFMLCCFLGGFALVGFRLLDVAVFSSEQFRYRHFVRGPEKDIERANILDRNGELLAVNLPTASIYAHPKMLTDPADTAKRIAKILPDINEKHLLEDFKSDRRFVWIKRNVTPKEEYAINHLGIPGVQFEHEQTRVYPYGHLLSHIVGFTNIDGEGIAGLEKSFDEQLRGDAGEGAKPLQITIDVRVQNVLCEELNQTIKEFRASGGSGIVLDANNGELLAMVSLPDFDPHNPGHAKAEQLFNSSTVSLYEMGSTFKTISMALALDSKKVKLKDRYDVSEPLRIARYKITDYHRKKEPQSVPEIFMYSSNIGTGKIALEVGAFQQRKFLKEIGLLDYSELEIPERAHPLYPKEARWGDVSTVTISYGHGIAVTPLHFAQAVAPVVNGGLYYPATLLKRSPSDDPYEPKRVLRKEASQIMRKLLRLTVKHGTGRRANVRGYVVGGKTGTANKPDKGGYSKDSRTSSFVSAFPMHDPRYVILLLLDNPKGNAATNGLATAGLTVAPAVGRVIKRIAPLLNVAPADMEKLDANDLWIDFKKPKHTGL